MELTIKEIELVCFGASIASGCKPCTTYHFGKVKEAGASEEEIKNAITASVCLCDAAKYEMRNHAMNLLGQSEHDIVTENNPGRDRISILVSIAAAFITNCTLTLNKYIDLGKSAGLTNSNLNRVFKAARFVKMKAASRVDNIAIRLGKSKKDEGYLNKSDSCSCGENEGNFNCC